jgi:hypothetical protein
MERDNMTERKSRDERARDPQDDANLVAPKASAERSPRPGAPDIDESTRAEAEALRKRREHAQSPTPRPNDDRADVEGADGEKKER